MKRISPISALLFASCALASANSYSTTFPATENPISQGGNWVNGLTNGLDWTDVQTTGGSPGEAFTTKGSGAEPPYNDSIASLTGTWGPNQMACGTAYIGSGEVDTNYQEVELHLNFAISAHSATGYVFNWHAVNDSSSYFGISRWNGALNNFTVLYQSATGVDGVNSGDTLCAISMGGLLAASRNGTLIDAVMDTTYTNGSPGIGFDQNCSSSACDALVGFTSFSASDVLGNGNGQNSETIMARRPKASAAAAPTFVQGKANTTATGVAGNTGLAFTSNVTSGNYIYALLYDGNSNGDTIVFSDSQGNTWTTPSTGAKTEASLATDGDTIAMACAKAGSTGADTVKWTINGSGTTGSGHAIIYETSNRTSNACTIDIAATPPNATGVTTCTTPATGTISTTVAEDFLLAGCGLSATQTAFTADDSYQNLLEAVGPSSGAYVFMAEWKAAAAASTYSAAPTYPSSSEYAGLLVAWKR